MGYLIKSLNLLKKSYNDIEHPLIEEDRLDILDLCLRQAKPLFIGLWEPSNKEVVDLKEIIINVPLLFAEKIHTLNITVDICIPSEMRTTIIGEPVFMEVILINAIGKIIYRVPNRGMVRVALQVEDGNFHLEIQDSGYVLTKTAAHLVTNAFNFFIEDDTFQQLCRDNGISYSTQRQSKGPECYLYKVPSPSRINCQ